jgi:hypothetical protein
VIAVRGPALSRWGIYLTSIQERSVDILFQLKTGNNAGQKITVAGTLGADFAHGLVCQIDGQLATQWEIWGKMAPGSPQVNLRFRFILDRVGGGASVRSTAVSTVTLQGPGIQAGPSFTVTGIV